MKLYRGYKTRPKSYLPHKEEERQKLERKLASGPPDEKVIDTMMRIGTDNFVKLYDLRRAAGSQFFTDDEVIARGFAGDKGFLIVIDVPDEIASAHFEGFQQMMRAGELGVSANYVFTGKELYDHQQDWQVDLVEIEREIAETKAERKVETGGSTLAKELAKGIEDRKELHDLPIDRRIDTTDPGRRV